MTIANGIGPQGQIVGTYFDNTINQAHGFLATPENGAVSAVAAAGPAKQEATSPALIAALATSLGGSQHTNNAPFAPSQAPVGSSPSSSIGATSTPQGTVQLGTAPNDGLHQFGPSHRPAASAAAWEVIDRVFADFDS